jgi:uncharacterized protein (DUF983 family)
LIAHIFFRSVFGRHDDRRVSNARRSSRRAFFVIFVLGIVLVVFFVGIRFVFAALPVFEVALEDLGNSVEVVEVDAPHLVECKLPIAFFESAAVDIEVVALHSESGVEAGVWEFVNAWLFGTLDFCLLFFDFLGGFFVGIWICCARSSFEGFEIREEFFFVGFAASAAADVGLLRGLFVRVRLWSTEGERDVSISLNVPDDCLIEELRVDRVLAIFYIVDAAKQNTAALVIGHCSSCA